MDFSGGAILPTYLPFEPPKRLDMPVRLALTPKLLSSVTPVARLILLGLRDSSDSLTIANLAEVSGATPSTVETVARKLLRRGLVVRTRVGCISHYELPVVAEVQ
jgi:hypothetical protein